MKTSRFHCHRYDVCIAAPPMCKSVQNDVCGQFQSRTSAQTNPTPDLTVSLNPRPNPLGGSRSARGRQGQSCHTIYTSLCMIFTCTSAEPCTHVRASIPVVPITIIVLKLDLQSRTVCFSRCHASVSIGVCIFVGRLVSIFIILFCCIK